MIYSRSYETPTGELSMLLSLGDDSGVPNSTVLAAGFCSQSELYERLPAARQDTVVALASERELESVRKLDRAVGDYLDGDSAAFGHIAVDQDGTEFQQAVWRALRATPAGVPLSYAQLATNAGRPKATRAVGTACARNLVAPIVPCHRIVRADGSLGGYYYGLEVKRWLLAHEAQPLNLVLSEPLSRADLP